MTSDTFKRFLALGWRSASVCTRLVLLSPALPLALRAQQTIWPGARSGHQMAWHAGLRQSVLLGGGQDSTLWGWDGSRWTSLGVGGPARRGQFAMAYDPARDRLIVHGGGVFVEGNTTPQLGDDTWEWDRRTWRKVSSSGPGARDHHAMAYDPVRKHVVLFGGNRSSVALNDTWAWDGREWKQLASDGPPARNTHRLAFDVKRGVMVVFGGFGTTGLLNDTWEWDGRRWMQVVTPNAPSARFAARIAYDATRERIVLFGGRAGSSNLGDTWEYDGRTWTKVDAAGPTLRNVHELVYDQRARATLLFGGFNAPATLSDFWSFNGAWKQIPRPDARPVGDNAYIAKGPYDVGFRVIDHWDRSRYAAPARDFEGRPNPNERAVPLQVSVWYPAQTGGTTMRFGEYQALSNKSATLGQINESDVAATSAQIRTGMTFLLGVDVPQTTADSIRDARVLAVRDAAPASGRFPLLVGGLAGPTSANAIGEYLASYGYVVVTASGGMVAATQEATARRPVAIETYTRNIETLQSIASTLPFVDSDRVALIASGPNGLAALMHEMRNMSASAIVTLDGQELQTGSTPVLRQSAYYDPARVRIPYLSFGQDNTPPQFAFSDSLPRELKYSTRYAYVVRDIEHAHLTGNLLVYPQLRAEQRLAYGFVWRTVRSFLDAYVKGDSSGKAFINRSAVQNGYPTWLVKTEIKLPANPPIPIAEEVEQIAMTGNVDRLRAILRQARAVDSMVRVFPVSDLNLFAFRYHRRGDHATAIRFNELAVEAYPRSTNAVNNLGNSYRDAGQPAKAVEMWERALSLLDADVDIAPANKASSRATIEGKIRQMRPGA